MAKKQRKWLFTKKQIVGLFSICLFSFTLIMIEILILRYKNIVQNLTEKNVSILTTPFTIQNPIQTQAFPTAIKIQEYSDHISSATPTSTAEFLEDIQVTNSPETQNPNRFSQESVDLDKKTIEIEDAKGLELSDQPMLIGHSVSGKPIQVYQFGTGKLERLIVAGIHGGNEYNTVLLAEALISHLKENPEIIPEDITLYIVPNLNPDGFGRAWDIHGRANDHGVDLNHNFPFEWKADWDRDGCWRYLYLNGGTKPASEPETKALIDFVLGHHIDALISYHSAALGIFAGGEPMHEDSAQLAEVISKVSPYPYPPIDTGCEMTGSLTDWSAMRDIASVDIELTNHRDTDFNENLAVLSIFLNWRR
jgi:predicted deacylase